MINYIIQVMLFQAMFLAVYDFFLHKETFFKANRFYLLGTAALSFIIPLIKLPTFQKTLSNSAVIALPEVVINPQEHILAATASELPNSINYLSIVFYSGAAVMLILFLFKLYGVVSILLKSKTLTYKNYKLVVLSSTKNAFSFFNYIFIHPSLLNNKKLSVLAHEEIHCKQYHTLDLLFFELLKIVQWFNPLIYIYQKRITVLHEYISDAEVIKTSNKQSYFNNLLAETFNVQNILFINQFYTHSLIKKRIVMSTKEKSKQIKKMKYLLLIPLLFLMLTYVACSNDDLSEAEITQVVEAINDVSDKYIDLKNGNHIYMGNELAGTRLNISEYTTEELRFHNLIEDKYKDKINFEVVIDNDEQRIMFLKMNKRFTPQKLDPKKYENAEEVPFAVIDKVPTFPGCEESTDLKMCFQEAITKHIISNFKSDVSKGLGLDKGTSKIFAMFTIDKDGNVTNIRTRAPHEKLNDEAKRVLEALPKMKPGEHSGKAVSVKYSLPIAFKVE